MTHGVPSGRVLVVVPTFQEVANVSTLIRRIRDNVPAANVLVVDDGSPDGTADAAESMGLEMGGVEVLRRDRKQGLGPAYRAGFRWGLQRGYEVLVGMDADLSHDPAALPRLLDGIVGGADLVIGSRYVLGGSIPDWSPLRRALSHWGNRYAAAGLMLGVCDATSGYRAYRREALLAIDLDQVRADGYGFQIELVYRLVRQGRVVTEVPIAFVDRRAGSSKMSPWIVLEALGLVSVWAARDRIRAAARRRR